MKTDPQPFLVSYKDDGAFQSGNASLLRQNVSSILRRATSKAAIARAPAYVQVRPFSLHRVAMHHSLSFSTRVFAI